MREPGSRVLTLLLFAAAAISTYADPNPNSISAIHADNIAGPLLVKPGQATDAWPPVPKEDQGLKENATDPGSAAMILEREIYTDDEKRVQTRSEMRSGFSGLGAALENAVLRGELSTTHEVADLRIRVERLERGRGQLP